MRDLQRTIGATSAGVALPRRLWCGTATHAASVDQLRCAPIKLHLKCTYVVQHPAPMLRGHSQRCPSVDNKQSPTYGDTSHEGECTMLSGETVQPSGIEAANKPRWWGGLLLVGLCCVSWASTNLFESKRDLRQRGLNVGEQRLDSRREAPRYACFAAATGIAPKAGSKRANRKPGYSAQQVVRYKLLQIFSLPTFGKIFAVLAVGLPIVLIGSYAYVSVTGSDWPTAARTIYFVLNNCPGADITSEDRGKAGLVLNLVFLTGLFSFAVVLGIVTDDISNAVAEVREGNYLVAENQHTVLLGWNRQMLPVLRQMKLAMEEAGPNTFGRPLVILADRAKDEMDDELIEELGEDAIDVVSRSGCPSKLPDLDKVAASYARTVVLLHPDGVKEDLAISQKAATLAALKASGGVNQQRVVIQSAPLAHTTCDADLLAIEQLCGNNFSDVVMISNLQRLGQLQAQAAIQPGLSRVFADLLQYDVEEGAEFYAQQFSKIDGHAFRDVRRRFSDATLCGYVPAGAERAILNPPDTTVLSSDDTLLFVAASKRDVRIRSAPVQVDIPSFAKSEKEHENLERNFVVLCFGDDSSSVLDSLADFCPRRSRITVVGRTFDGQKKRRGHAKICYVVGNPASTNVLQEARVGTAGSVIIMGMEEYNAEEADSQVVASVLQLQQLAADAHRTSPLHVVANINTPSTAKILTTVTENLGAEQKDSGFQACLHLQIFNPDELLSGMLTQVAAEPLLNLVFQEIFSSSRGCEFYIRSPGTFGIAENVSLSWAQVAETVRAKEQLAIGVIDANNEMKLTPKSDQILNFQGNEKLVVISES